MCRIYPGPWFFVIFLVAIVAPACQPADENFVRWQNFVNQREGIYCFANEIVGSNMTHRGTYKVTIGKPDDGKSKMELHYVGYLHTANGAEWKSADRLTGQFSTDRDKILVTNDDGDVGELRVEDKMFIEKNRLGFSNMKFAIQECDKASNAGE